MMIFEFTKIGWRMPSSEMQFTHQKRGVLLLRWFLGSTAGSGLSAWFFIDLLNSENAAPALAAMPFIGQYYLFAFLFLHLGIGDFISSTMSWYVILCPVLICGLIGALLSSGQSKQTIAGLILLILCIVIGSLSYMIFKLNLILSA
jgi:hypothetical protein